MVIDLIVVAPSREGKELSGKALHNKPSLFSLGKFPVSGS
jgi:hypothetical protein